MSRVGKQPVEIPQGVKAELSGQQIEVKGPKGILKRSVRPEVKVELVDGKVVFAPQDESRQARAFFGMERSLVNNMVQGVAQGFEKQLRLVGVGYRAELKGNTLDLGLGYSHQIEFPVPDGVKASVAREGREIFIKIEGADKQLVGQVAARIRSLRPPEPYKGKGVRYRDEQVKRKAGKAGKK